MEHADIGPKDMARMRGCTLKYVYDLLLAGRIPGARKVGRHWRIPIDAATGSRTPIISGP
jgi:excisionase family DNA binding protein